jgi:hypothetical protein
MTALAAPGYISDNARTEGQKKQFLEDLNAVLKETLGGSAETELTLSGGSITPAAGGHGLHRVDTEADAATDDLTNIATTNVRDGGILVLRNENTGRTVVVKHNAGGAGQVFLADGVDVVLSDAKSYIMLKRNGTQFDEVFRGGPNALGAISWRDGGSVPSAATLFATAAAAAIGNFFDVTGTTTINGIHASAKSPLVLRFGAGIQLTNGASFALLGGQNRVTEANDLGIYYQEAGVWREVSYVRKTSAPLRGHGGQRVLGASCKNNAATPNTQFDLDCSETVLRNPTDGTVLVYREPAVDTVNISTAGPAANGRDQAGAFSASSFIHLYYISDGTNLDGIASAAAPSAGPTLPTGYTHWAYVGTVRIDGSGNLLRQRINGDWIHYDGQQAALTNGTAFGSEAAIDLSSLVPANALLVQGLASGSHGGSNSTTVTLALVTGTVFRNHHASPSVDYKNQSQVTFPNVGQNIYYFWAGSSANREFDFHVEGYSVANGG